MTTSRVEREQTERRHARVARARRCLLAVFHALAIIITVQLSGMGHDLGDLVSWLVDDGAAEPEDHCENDTSDRECPPGCPSCHCTHPAVGIPEREASVPLPLLVPREARSIAPVYDDRIPLGPELPSVFRPPRSARAHG